MFKRKIIAGILLTFIFSIFVSHKNINAVTYDAITVLTAQEVDLYSKHPWAAIKAKNAASDAETAAQKYWKGYTLYQGNGDAFRHAYWSALMTKRISRDFAYEAGLAHEGLKKDYKFEAQSADNKMDISNNYSGRIEGDKFSNYSDNVIRDVLLINTKKGFLKRIRVYTSKKKENDKTLNGVYTKYKGYYVKTTDGGFNG